MRKSWRPGQEGRLSIGQVYLVVAKSVRTIDFYNHALGKVANLFRKVILCIQWHAVMFVQVYDNPFIG